MPYILRYWVKIVSRKKKVEGLALVQTQILHAGLYLYALKCEYLNYVITRSNFVFVILVQSSLSINVTSVQRGKLRVEQIF